MADPVKINAPITYTGPDGDNITFDPAHNCPDTWGDKVMGFDLGGKTAAAPTDYSPAPTETNKEY